VRQCPLAAPTSPRAPKAMPPRWSRCRTNTRSSRLFLGVSLHRLRGSGIHVWVAVRKAHKGGHQHESGKETWAGKLSAGQSPGLRASPRERASRCFPSSTPAIPRPASAHTAPAGRHCAQDEQPRSQFLEHAARQSKAVKEERECACGQDGAQRVIPPENSRRNATALGGQRLKSQRRATPHSPPMARPNRAANTTARRAKAPKPQASSSPRRLRMFTISTGRRP